MAGNADKKIVDRYIKRVIKQAIKDSKNDAGKGK